MGMDDRDGAYRSRGPSPRRRPYDGDDLPARSSSRAPREMENPRARPPRRDYDDSAYDRPTRDPRGGSSARSNRDGYSREGSNRDGYDRRPRPGSSRYDEYDRPSRSGRGDPGGSNPRGERTMRSGRPSARDEGWGEPRGGRSGARAGAVADSSGRMRRPAQPGASGRGGLWGDEAQSLGGARGGLNARDPRARHRAAQYAEEDEESESPAAGVAKALGALVLALVLGAGAAYGYFIFSTPKLHVAPNQQAIPTSPASTPSITPAPSATKSALLQPPAVTHTLLID